MQYDVSNNYINPTDEHFVVAYGDYCSWCRGNGLGNCDICEFIGSDLPKTNPKKD